MLLYCHYLYAVVSVGLHSWQYVFAKLGVCAHLLGILRHTYVALVDEQRRTVGLECLAFPLVRFRIPHLCRENLGFLILHHAPAPCRNALAGTAVPIDMHFEQVAVLYSLFTEFQFPVAGLVDTLCLVAVGLLPVVEVAHKIDCGSVGCPLSKHPSTRQLMKSVIFVTVGKVGKFLLSIGCKSVDFPQCMFMTPAYRFLKRLQVSIITHQTYMLGRCFASLHFFFCFCCHI